MSLLRNHIVLMFIYAVATGIYFSLLWKNTREERIKFFFLVFCSLFIGGIVLAWVMYPFPLGK
jgi:NhaP-type Na+/H+ or K+/H+ antiporter